MEFVNQNIWTLIISWGTIQCSILPPIILLQKKNPGYPRILLSCLILVIGYQSFNFLYSYFGWYNEFPHLIWVSSPLWFLIGPLIYFFERFSTIKNFVWKWIHLLHLIPFILSFIYMSSFYGLSGDLKIQIFEQFYTNYEADPDYYFYAFIISQSVYGILIFRNFRHYFNNVGEEFSDNSIYKQKNILILVAGFNIFWITTLIYHFVLLTDFEAFFPYDYVTYIFLTLFIQIIGLQAITNHNSFFSFQIQESDGSTENQINFGEHDAENILSEVIEFIENEKPYLNSTLKISELSDMVDIPTYKLSYLINTFTNKNFYDLINDYRIEEVKKRLPNPEYSNLTLDAIAKDCGFNSNATFYRIFKTKTGITPKQFLTKAD